MLGLAYRLNTKGYQQESSNCLKANFLYHIQNITCPPNQTLLSLNPYPYLISHTGYYLSYNFVTQKLEAMVALAEKAYCLPLQIYKNNGKIRLMCIHNGVIFELKYHDDQSLFSLSLPLDDYTSNHIKLGFSDYRVFIHSINSKGYIAISPDRTIFAGPQPKEYESFTPISMISPETLTM